MHGTNTHSRPSASSLASASIEAELGPEPRVKPGPDAPPPPNVSAPRGPVSIDLCEAASFLGRDAELTALLRALEAGDAAPRGLITVAGPAGIGKTRMVRRAAKERLKADRDVVLADLAPARSRADVVATVAQALDISIAAERDDGAAA